MKNNDPLFNILAKLSEDETEYLFAFLKKRPRVETKQINGTAYNYLRFREDGKLRSLYLGKKASPATPSGYIDVLKQGLEHFQLTEFFKPQNAFERTYGCNAESLCANNLILGAIGCGKTSSALFPLLRQLGTYHTKLEQGGLVIDPKGDVASALFSFGRTARNLEILHAYPMYVGTLTSPTGVIFCVPGTSFTGDYSQSTLYRLLKTCAVDVTQYPRIPPNQTITLPESFAGVPAGTYQVTVKAKPYPKFFNIIPEGFSLEEYQDFFECVLDGGVGATTLAQIAAHAPCTVLDILRICSQQTALKTHLVAIGASLPAEGELPRIIGAVRNTFSEFLHDPGLQCFTRRTTLHLTEALNGKLFLLYAPEHCGATRVIGRALKAAYLKLLSQSHTHNPQLLVIDEAQNAALTWRLEQVLTDPVRYQLTHLAAFQSCDSIACTLHASWTLAHYLEIFRNKFLFQTTSSLTGRLFPAGNLPLLNCHEAYLPHKTKKPTVQLTPDLYGAPSHARKRQQYVEAYTGALLEQYA